MDHGRILKGLKITFEQMHCEIGKIKAIDKIFESWPILSKPIFFLEHVKLLTGNADIFQQFEYNLSSNYTKFISYFEKLISEPPLKIKRTTETERKKQEKLQKCSSNIRSSNTCRNAEQKCHSKFNGCSTVDVSSF